ncbi:MAG: hypothetical protein FWE79_02210, partial [Firmicutes bacterium]|nr:hypothetical protein [Bacillota bacterium]
AILDPACGTGTFGAEIIKFIKEKYFSGGNSAFYKKWIQDKNGLLSRLIGFEIMMTSYVVAHLKIRRTIAETLGEQPDEILPSNIFLTNTLAEPKSLIEKNQQQSFFDFSGAITEEAENADKWKSRRPIKVIIGNPPYLAASKNPFDITAYKTETDGVTDFKERKHWLNDDYVKFIRFAEQRIEKDGSGILAFISNNGYLDNQTFRGMRASLLRTFDKIFILDLHGNAVKKETAPDGSKDENVFDIQQGVGIIIGIKTTRNKDWAKVYHADLFGTRENKFSALDKKNIVFKKLDIDTKMAYFIPQNETGKDTYEDGVNISELFLTNVTGVMSGNNDISLASTEKELRKRIDIVNNALNEEPIQKLWGSFSRGQTADKIQKDLLDKEGKITPIAFRPFEDKWTYYSGTSCGWLLWAREKKTMGQLVHSSTSPIGKNIAFIYGRAAHISNDFAMVFVSDKIIDKGLLDVVHQAYISPLYNAPSGLEKEWTPNFNKEQLDKLTQNLKNKPTPIEIFDYCYGVLYDPTYREKYNEFLKRDFPRVPVIENEKTFDKYKNIGKLLRELHLMQTEAKFNLVITGTNLKIDLVKYTNGKLHINKETTIAGIPQNVWNYFIGGYQVLDKWFKSHKGEELDIGKFNHIQKVVGILAETIKLQDVLR